MIHGHREFESDHKPGLRYFHLLSHWFWNTQARWKIQMGPILMNRRAWNQRHSKNFHILKNEIQIGYKYSFACEYKLTSASKLCLAVYSKAYLDRQVDEICPRSPMLNYRPILSFEKFLKMKSNFFIVVEISEMKYFWKMLIAKSLISINWSFQK